MIPVTKTYLPPIEDYQEYLEEIWKSGWVTNNGTLSQKLEKDLASYLKVPHMEYVSSGTIALQIAIRVLELEGEIITTPFSYVATTSSILWDGCTPVFVDIDPKTLNINPNEIEKKITDKTSAILATHIFGVPCDVKAIEEIAQKHDLKVIYDGAHAFGVNLEGKSVFLHGDISIVSFHATKIFHTVEGGGLVTKEKELAEKIALSKAFGHSGDEHFRLGINGKNSEFHAAIGLCILKKIDTLIERRKAFFELYRSRIIDDKIKYQSIPKNIIYNYGYYPIIFNCEEQLLRVYKNLKKENIFPRRYFYPSLNELDYLTNTSTCPHSEKISKSILCLPLYEALEERSIIKTSEIVNETVYRL